MQISEFFDLASGDVEDLVEVALYPNGETSLVEIGHLVEGLELGEVVRF